MKALSSTVISPCDRLMMLLMTVCTHMILFSVLVVFPLSPTKHHTDTLLSSVIDVPKYTHTNAFYFLFLFLSLTTLFFIH